MTAPLQWRSVRCSAWLQLLFTAVALAVPLSQARNASADGMMFQPSGVTSEVRAEAQRAVLWLRDGDWELTIYPLFERDAGSSAWVVPFPVRPTITEGSADLFDELETITAPVTIEYCYDPYCCCGDDWCDAGVAGGEGAADGVDAAVDVWERGVVGSFDYVVLSSADGDSIATWLGDNGFELPDDATPLLDTLASEGSFFFAAKLSADTNPEAPVTPVTFALADLEDPLYPLRLTAAGVGADDTLALVLWLVTPKEFIHAVANDFEPRIDYHGVLAYHPFVLNPIDCVDIETVDYYFFAYCVDFTMFGYELNRPFSAPLQEIIDSHYVVTRYSTELDAAAMANDMLFEPNEDPSLAIHSEQYDGWSNISAEETGACYSCPDCPDQPDPPVEPYVDAGEIEYPDRAEEAPDAGVFPDIYGSVDAGQQDHHTDSRGAIATEENVVGCSATGRSRPTGLGGLLLLIGLVALGARRR